jgi:hypothetical protein
METDVMLLGFLLSTISQLLIEDYEYDVELAK